MALSIYHYVIILTIFLLGRLIFRWLIALCFQLRFGHIGFFSVSDICYRQTSKDATPTDKFSLSVGRVKFRIKRPTSSLSTAWITLHIKNVVFSIYNLQTTNTHPPGALSRRISRMGNIPHIPWWYSISLVKHIVKFTSALPAQFLMAGLANYVDIQLDGLLVTVENINLVQVDSINFSSILFAAVRQSSIEIDSHHPLLNAGHQRHSLKRAQHLFKEKFFEIILQLGPVAICDQILQLPQGGRIAISCHLSAGCLTLKDVDTSLHIDALGICLDKVSTLKSLLQKRQSLPQHQRPIDNTNTKRRNLYLLDIIRSMALSISHIRITKDYEDGKFLGVDIDYINSTATIVSQGTASQMAKQGSLCKLQMELEQMECFISDSSTTSFAQRLFSLPVVNMNASFPTANHSNSSNSTALEDDNEGPNNQVVQMNLTVDGPVLSIDTEKISLLKAMTVTSDASSQSSTAVPAELGITIRRLPKLSLMLKLDSPEIHVAERDKTNSLGIIKWSTILLDGTGEYVRQNDIRPPLLPGKSEQQMKEQQEQSDQEGYMNSSLRKRKQNGARWTKLFRNSWRFRRQDEADDNQEQTSWVYNTTARMAIQDMEMTMKRDNMTAAIPLLFIQSVEGAVGTCMSTFNTEDRCVMVIWNVKGERNELDISVNGLTIYPCATIPGDPQLLLIYWLSLVKELQHTNKTPLTQQGIPRPKAKKVHEWMDNWLRWFRVSMLFAQSKFVMEGFDKGLKGKQPVPDGFIDNAPIQDIYVRVTTTVERVELVFHGASHKSDHPATDTASLGAASCASDATHRKRFSLYTTEQIISSLQCTIQSVKVVRLFKSHSLDDSDSSDLVLWMPRLTANVTLISSSEGCSLTLSTIVKRLGHHFSTANHYALLLALHSIRSIKSLLISFSAASSTITEAPPSTADLVPGTKWWKIEKAQIQLNRVDCRVTLPERIELFVRIDGIRTEMKEHEQPCIHVRNTALYGVDVNDDTRWDQLVEIDNFRYSQHKQEHHLFVAKLYLRVPYRYIVADLADNSVNLIKYLKSLEPRLSGDKPFTYFGSILKNEPLSLPTLRLCCDKLTIQLEDDPFEARLRMIWRTGLAEQRSRLEVLDAFEAKARTEGEERVQQARQRLNEHNSNTWMKHIDASIHQETTAFEKLRNQSYRATSNEAYCSIGNRDYMDKSQIMDSAVIEMFNIDVIELPRHFPLIEFTILNTTLGIRPPDFPLEQTRSFMHDVGKGVPLDTNFTTLAPFHLGWHGGETWIQLRDYPVPLFHVSPGPREDDELTKAWTLSGDYVFGDQAGDLDSTRTVSVQILDDARTGLQYTMEAVRTASPPKFYSIVNIEVHTPQLTSLCWCVPYQPAIQDLSRTMDTFTRPPVDPSSKVGIWDKIRLMIHTQTTISFTGGGDLALVLKGSRDPYDLSDRGFGLAKLWKKNVVWRMGHSNPEGEFMQIISHDLLFGVPDLVNGGYRVPHLLLSPSGRTVNDIYQRTASNSQQKQRPYRNTKGDGEENDTFTIGSMTSNGDDSLSMSSSSDARLNAGNQFDHDMVEDETVRHEFLKVALRFTGGIRMGLGCHLERLCVGKCEKCQYDQERCRLLHFRPHYDVKYKSPRAVEAMENHGKNYDAFAGFRSDFIHFSMSIVKLSEKEYELSTPYDIDTGRNTAINALYLSPGFLDHFLATARLFGGNMSYPLRTGSLYSRVDNRLPKKFGAHMQSMKFKVVVSPLRLGYFYKDDALVEGAKSYMAGHGDAIGLKGHVKTFSIDLHQQREQMTAAEYDKSDTAQLKRPKPGWLISEAEVELRNIDLRVVRACYSENGQESQDTSMTEAKMTESGSDEEVDPDFMDGTDRRADENEVDSTWIDLEDFVELNVITPETIPKVQVLPFAFSPCMYYIKQNNPDDIQKYRYLRGTHDCIIGTAPDTREMQMSLLKERSQNIDIQIRKHQTRLNNVEKKLAERMDDKLLLKESKTIVEKTEILFEKRNLLQRYIRDLSSDVMPGCTHDPTAAKAAHSDSTIFGEDSISRWEEKMGHFKIRYIVHNPQIIWNNSVRNIVYHFMDLQAHKRALSYYMSARAVKFLRDLTKKHQSKRRLKKEAFFVEDDEEGLGQDTVQQLLDRLISEQSTKFYAQNETEMPPSTGGFDGDNVDMCDNDHVKNPDRQLETIPNGYSMRSSYLIDLLNPQVSLQSDCDPDNLVLMSNERMQVKSFSITEDKETDMEMQLVKDRTIVSLDNTQFFVAKKEQFDTVDLLLDNHYGAKGHEHWLTWIPSEMLISYVKRSDKFQRVGTQLSPTIQIEKYNGLRLKTHSSLFGRYRPFEERCDSVRLNFPNLALTADSAQYNAIYEVVVDLLLYKEPAKKERLERLHEIMMAADQGSLNDATENIVELQHRVRQCLALRDQYQQNITMLDDDHLEEFRKIRLALQESCEDLYLGMEAFKLLQTNVRNDHSTEASNSWKFVFSAAKLSWEMRVDSETPLCEWHLNNTTFTSINKDDHSHTNTIEVDLLQVKNTSANPVYTDVLSPFIDQRSKLPDFSRHKMLRCYLEALAPVGGIPVIQHLEINLFPLRLQMTYDFGKSMASYFFPAERRQKDANTITPASSSAPPTSSSSSAAAPSHNAPYSMTGSPNVANFSSSGSVCGGGGGGSDTNSITSDSLRKSVSANLELKDKESVTGRNGSGYPRSATAENIRSTSSAIDMPTNALPSISPSGKEALDTMDLPTGNGHMNDGSSSAGPATPPAVKTAKRNRQKEVYPSDDLSVMKKRASGNRAFILVKIPGTKHCLTYKGPKEKNIEDLRDFTFQQPYLEYRNKTWSWFELLSNIKRDFMRAALVHNSRALLKEKLTIRRHPRGDTLFSNGSMTESSFLAAMIPAAAEISPRQSTYEWEGDSGDSDSEDLDSKDDASLHSATSYDVELDVHLDKKQLSSSSTPTTASSGHPLSWTNKFKRKIAIKPEVNGQPPPTSYSSPDLLSKKAKVNTLAMEELTTKGRLLMGKHYQGPTIASTTIILPASHSTFSST